MAMTKEERISRYQENILNANEDIKAYIKVGKEKNLDSKPAVDSAKSRIRYYKLKIKQLQSL